MGNGNVCPLPGTHEVPVKEGPDEGFMSCIFNICGPDNFGEAAQLTHESSEWRSRVERSRRNRN